MENFFSISLYAAIALLALTTAVIMYRLARGPSLADRVTAFDAFTCAVIGILAVFAMRTGKELYIDVILTLAFVAFMGAIAFSYYLKKRKKI